LPSAATSDAVAKVSLWRHVNVGTPLSSFSRLHLILDPSLLRQSSLDSTNSSAIDFTVAYHLSKCPVSLEGPPPPRRRRLQQRKAILAKTLHSPHLQMIAYQISRSLRSQNT
jgi:hypothetical protein